MTLYGKYKISKSDGTPVDSTAKYIVLRYDAESNDPIARQTILHYCQLGGVGTKETVNPFYEDLWNDVVYESRKHQQKLKNE